MKKRKVWRYSCDFCGKSNCSASSIASHEKGCTLNPNRVCRVCPKLEKDESLPLADLVALVDSITEREPKEKEAIAELRKAAGNCPACMLAAIRQSRKLRTHREHTTIMDPDNGFEALCSFNFKTEMRDLWADFNNHQYEEDYRGSMCY